MKQFSSNIEDLRLQSEEYNTYSKGNIISPAQYWRDTDQIPQDISTNTTILKTYSLISLDKTISSNIIYNFSDNSDTFDGIGKIEKAQLSLIPGTINCYNIPIESNKYKSYLSDIISPNFGNNYMFKLYIDDTELPFGFGLPEIDVENGIIKFTKDSFNEDISGKTLLITFYKYYGRKGLSGIESLPFSDSLIHFKQSTDSTATASFLVRGGSGDNKYIIPPVSSTFYQKENTTYKVILLQENLQAAINHQIIIDGGEW